MSLRYYQQAAKDAVFKELETHRSTVAVMATGLGKSRLFAHVAKDWPGRVLVLVHRAELLDQAVAVLEEQTGEIVEIEQGTRRSGRARLVVGMVQTMSQDRRLQRMGPDAFSLVIPDEVHGYLAKTRKKVLEFFSSAKVFGVTATADRTDKQALSQIMDSVAYRMDIQDGIHSGYLVPIQVGRVHIKSIDLTGVNKVRGDLHEGKLEQVMLRNVGAIVSETLRLHPNRQGICFFPGVESAELAAHHFNARNPGSAIFIDGRTDKDERKQMVEEFKAGNVQWLCNCQVATEGFDAPKASLIVMARPTTSRSLYTQMAGRGTRVDATCVQGIDGPDKAEERRGAILWSSKPNCMILDFVGNSGKHELISPVDLLGGEFNTEEKKIATRLLDELDPGETPDPEELLLVARKQLEARHRAIRELGVMVKAEVSYVDAFSALGMDREKIEAQELEFGRSKMSPATKDTLVNFGVSREEVSKMGKLAGSKMLRTLFSRKRYGLCDYGTLQLLKKWGVKTSRIYQRQGKEAAVYIAECGFGKTQAVDKAHLIALATGS